MALSSGETRQERRTSEKRGGRDKPERSCVGPWTRVARTRRGTRARDPPDDSYRFPKNYACLIEPYYRHVNGTYKE